MNKHLLFLCLVALPCLLGNIALRDPTQPPDYQGAEVSKNPFELNAIFIHPNERFAIINGTQMMVGNHLGEYIITTITPNTVELTGNKNSREVLQLIVPVRQDK